MIKTKELPAFTLQETVIVMIITTVVVGLAFTVLTLVQRHMLSIQQNFNTRTEINRLEAALWADFNKAGKIELRPQTQQLIFHQVLDTVAYTFNKNYVSRDKDTMALGIVSAKFFKAGDPVSSGSIDALEWGFSTQQPNQKLMVFKYPDASQYFE